MRKLGTTRHKWAQHGRSLELWCDAKKLGIQLRVHPSCENPDLLDEWVKVGIELDTAEAVSLAAAIMTQVARMQNEAKRERKATILRP